MQPTSLKSRILLSLFFLFVACSAFDKTKHTEEIQQAMTKHKHINRLAKESSPYLLQHAHNPVDWFPWGEEALEKAKREDKLILISIGYAACHWCHVMEHESFEDEAVAKVMNESFVCIKVDREERPDIDQVYMNAVQLLTGRGGWPLNCFALPDGRPVHGGTYFPKAQWLQILDGLKTVYAQDRDRVLKAASEIQRGIQTSEVISTKTAISEFQQDYLAQVIEPWKKEFDTVWGGSGESPKFPMPNSLRFLLRYAFFTGDEAVNTQLFLTLDRMAHGGIYDQIGGGFARYSVDKYWKAPHFEKMLYDNGQLLSLYSEAYLLNPKRLYKETVYETIQFAQRELLSKEGGFYASLDADSEGVEGKYYTFKANEFADLLNQDNHILRAFYNITEEGNWEETNIPFIVKSETEFAEEHKIAEADLWNMLKNFKTSSYQAREKRIRPGLDDKILASWNGLMLKGLVDAYRTFGEHTFLELAEKNAEFIANKLITDDHRLFRNYKNSTASVNAFLDDYAFVIEGFLALYQVSFDEKWLGLAENLMEYARVHFEDEESGMFFFTSDLDPELVARKMELNDGVIPASNSQMALNLFYLGKLLYNDEYLTMANQMLHNVKAFIPKAGAYYSNWATLAALEVFPFYEIAIVGADAQAYRSELQATYRPNAIYAGSLQKSEVPLLTDRFVKGETRIYVCQDKACQMPAKSVEDAENQIDKLKR